MYNSPEMRDPRIQRRETVRYATDEIVGDLQTELKRSVTIRLGQSQSSLAAVADALGTMAKRAVCKPRGSGQRRIAARLVQH
jgi:hypothetical protein